MSWKQGTGPSQGAASGEASVTGPFRALLEELGGREPRVRSAFHDPRVVEAAGKALAERAAQLRPEIVLSPDQWRDMLLGHIVARELAARTTHIYDAQGTVELSESLTRGAPCLLVATSFERPNSVRAALAAVKHHGGAVVGVGCLRRTAVLEQELGADVALIDLAPR